MRYERWDLERPEHVALLKKYNKWCLWVLAVSLLSTLGIFVFMRWGPHLENGPMALPLMITEIGFICLALVAAFAFLLVKITVWAARKHKEAESREEQKHPQ